jgi:ribosomal protein S21
MINVEVVKSANENNIGIIRRFTKKVQGSGVLPKVRSKRYSQRNISFYKTKKNTLEGLKRKADIMELIKMGKMADRADGPVRGKKK